jgi:photosystem II stability/assembly factor-like uncharacterized protein
MHPRVLGHPATILALVLAASTVSAQRSKTRKTTDQTPAASVRTSDSATLVLPHGFEARSIGPAAMGGRVSSIAFDPKRPSRYYVGFGMGGVMKTSDNGITFKPIFTHEKVAAIGDVAVSPSDPTEIWVGTGEANDRNSGSWGDGVYLSTDTGTTWKNVGLKDSKSIARIAVHPTDPKTAYAAVIGDLWMPNSERGLYKTTDAGGTWRKVLGAQPPYDDRVGAGDVAIDPSDPNVVYATLYARRRRPWSFTYGPAATDGKDLGGIFKSTDGGATWHKLTDGLPGEMGRIGLSLDTHDPHILFAVVQSDAGGTVGLDDALSKAGGVFRSGDAGEHWTRVSKLDPRPFYFSQIRVDPADSLRIYLLGFVLLASDDGGVTWREDLGKAVHPDNHALAIDPLNHEHLLLGNDGGLYQSFNRAVAWDHLSKFGVGEFYRVNVDRSTPFRVCGGLQDNNSWVGPSETRSKEEIRNGDWQTLSGGDGSYCAFDPADSNIIYFESQGADLVRLDLRSGQDKSLRPQPTEGEPAFRFHWLAPFIMSAHEPGTMYLAGNIVFKMTDRGEHWQVISPDLSTKDLARMQAVGSGAETYGVVFTLAESPVKAGVLWAGTDDGKLWRTDDDGGHWSDLTATIPQPARGHMVSRIEASHTDANGAYVAWDGAHDGEYAPLVYRTTDGGATWQSIVGNLPKDEPMRLVREDPDNGDVLYAGSEHGCWLSLDRGRSWSSFGELPTTAVDDILIEPKTHSIVIATQGRSLYVVDRARPLTQLPRQIMADTVHVFAPDTAIESQPLPSYDEWTGRGQFRGENPPNGVLLTYYLSQATGDSVAIAITTKEGRPVAHLTGAAMAGLNRVAWDLQPSKDVLASYGGGQGAKYVHPGSYTVTVTYGKAKSSAQLEVRAVPGLDTL